MNLRRTLLLAASLWLAACTSLPTTPLPGREEFGDFAIEARFALRVTLGDNPPQNSGGRLSWIHQGNQERILIANPIGIGLAEIESTPALSRLKTGDGRILESTDPDSLLAEATGQSLPVSRLPGWLLGRPGQSGKLVRDPNGRPQHLSEAGWQIDYLYPDEAPESLPSRLNLQRGQEIDLRLRIEEWKTQP